jgi:hypothetical protein
MIHVRCTKGGGGGHLMYPLKKLGSVNGRLSDIELNQLEYKKLSNIGVPNMWDVKGVFV